MLTSPGPADLGKLKEITDARRKREAKEYAQEEYDRIAKEQEEERLQKERMK